ncbi:DMT family transporter [Aureimonas pseudogalii]|uniref:Drug/metabolite transporter (DMT)-like permease n=1 Tax=Aureimonas pseudogalii TaxID=1744844 RepID=A0A7W6H264_9HYPH|nr:DMT family transporter [Aureimonas pseudogalii]MBB3996290.1 drug/metabolite transporter (DMT)-like permease [Aureimonas pseudogalii]
MSRLLPLFPAFFVLLWSTGFVGARYAMPHAEPFTFLSLRYALALAILLPVALWAARTHRAGLPALAHAAFAGSLIHAAYLGGVFFAVRHGLPAGIAALVAGLQPLITAVIAHGLLSERLERRHWIGLAVGLGGVALVVAPKLGTGAAFGPATLVPAVVAVIAISLGTVWQKRFVGTVDLRIGTAAQYAGALLPTLMAAFFFETRAIDWTPQFVLALVWLTLALSIGAVFLLLVLIRRGAVSRVASLMYLVPGVTAVMGFVLFGETLQPVQILGMALAAGGVAVATGALGRRAPRGT